MIDLRDAFEFITNPSHGYYGVIGASLIYSAVEFARGLTSRRVLDDTCRNLLRSEDNSSLTLFTITAQEEGLPDLAKIGYEIMFEKRGR